MIFASVPVLQPPEEMLDTRCSWEGCGPELLIVDNTTDRAWEPLAKEQGWSYLTLGKNLGVCASWNAARASFMAAAGSDHDLLLLFSASINWRDGLAASMAQFQEAANWKGCQSGFGPHAIAWSRRVLEIAGDWDCNYYPGYLGDTDYFRRLIVEGILIAGPDAMPRIEINAPEPEDGRAVERTGLITNTVCCSAYYEAKHGGPPSEETFTTPFDSGLPTWFWTPAYRPGMEFVDLTTSRYR